MSMSMCNVEIHRYMEMEMGAFIDTFMKAPEKRTWKSEPLYTFAKVAASSPEDAEETGMLFVCATGHVGHLCNCGFGGGEF